MFTTEVLRLLKQSVLCWFATVDEDEVPNVSPKEVFAPVGDDVLVVAHIASPQTVRNIAERPAVCVSFVDVPVQKGYKLRGTARIVPAGDPDHDRFFALLETITQGEFPVKAVIAVKVSSVESIVAPSYWLKPGTTEDTQVAAALQTYLRDR